MIQEIVKMGKDFDFWQEHSMQYLEMAQGKTVGEAWEITHEKAGSMCL